MADPASDAEERREPSPERRPSAFETWERRIALTIGIVTLAGVVLSFQAVRRNSQAADADRRAVHEAVLVYKERLAADTQARAEAIAAGQFRRMLAEADALDDVAASATRGTPVLDATTLADRAGVLRAVADRFAFTAFDIGSLDGAGADAQFDVERRLQALEMARDFDSLPPDQPAKTARIADDLRTASQRYVLGVVALLAAVCILTVARVGPARARLPLASSAIVIAVAATIGAFLQDRV